MSGTRGAMKSVEDILKELPRTVRDDIIRALDQELDAYPRRDHFLRNQLRELIRAIDEL